MLWVATGLNMNLTGIERFALALFDELLKSRVIAPSDLTVFVDPTATWVVPLADTGVHLQYASHGRWSRPSTASDTLVCHNLGAGLFPTRAKLGDRSFRIFSVYDWGPFRDQTMPLKGRVAWAQAMIRGMRQADMVHLLNANLIPERPFAIRSPIRTVVAYPGSALIDPTPRFAMQPLTDPPKAVFVGTASARKRIDLIVRMASASGTHVVLLGAGTENFTKPPFVLGLGRVEDSLLSDALDRATALILVSDYEGFGVPIIEAASRGIVSVVSAQVRANLPSELDPFTIAVDPRDSIAFANAIGTARSLRGVRFFRAADLLSPLIAIYGRTLSPT